MVFPDVSYENWVLKYPDLIVTDENCEINFCEHCQGRIIPKTPFIKKGYVGLISQKCPHCEKATWTSVSITNSKKEYEAWSSFI